MLILEGQEVYDFGADVSDAVNLINLLIWQDMRRARSVLGHFGLSYASARRNVLFEFCLFQLGMVPKL